ncbi:MAG: hypothetical protein ACYSOI_02300, partial [Planctomycetota bacterium]
MPPKQLSVQTAQWAGLRSGFCLPGQFHHHLIHHQHIVVFDVGLPLTSDAFPHRFGLGFCFPLSDLINH